MSRDIPITLIDADASQPRRHFETAALQELADSLANNGQVVPITVRPMGDRFVIVQGERRWRAAKLAGLTSLRAEVSTIDANAAYLLALIENIQRADLTPLEEAVAYQRLLGNGYNQTTLGKRIGKTQSYVAQKLRLLKLPAEVQTKIDNGTLTEGHARQLLRLDSADQQLDLGNRAATEDWSVNDIRTEVDFVLLVQQPSKNYKLKDLIEFIKRVAFDGATPRSEYHMRAERQLGQCLVLCKRMWEEYKMPQVSQGVMEEFPLSEIKALFELDNDLRVEGLGLPDLMKFGIVSDDDFEKMLVEIMSKGYTTEPELRSAFCKLILKNKNMSRDMAVRA